MEHTLDKNIIGRLASKIILALGVILGGLIAIALLIYIFLVALLVFIGTPMIEGNSNMILTLIIAAVVGFFVYHGRCHSNRFR